MRRFYLCKTIGDGSDGSPFAPAIILYSKDWVATDMRGDATIGGNMFVACTYLSDKKREAFISLSLSRIHAVWDRESDIERETAKMYSKVASYMTSATHEVILLDNRITYVDIGSLALDTKVSARAANLKTTFDTFGIDVASVTSESTVRDVVKGVVKQCLLRQNPLADTRKTHYDN